MADSEATVRVRVRAFAQVREALGEGEFEMTLPHGSTLVDLWDALRLKSRTIDKYASTTRLARNGRVVALLGEHLSDGDEVMLLPPVGGG